eukprot:6916267-Karenia_brevis.AAC.1
MSCLLELAKQSIGEQAYHLWSMVYIFGYVENHQCEHITTSLQILAKSGVEWGHQEPVYIASADIKSAFDYVSPALVMEALLFWGVHPHIALCIIVELVDLTCEVMVSGLRPTGKM